MDKTQQIIKKDNKAWRIFAISVFPILVACIYSLYVTKAYENISVSDIEYLYKVKLILRANLISFLAVSFALSSILTPFVHFLWRPDSSFQKKYYDKYQIRLYNIESAVITVILMIPMIFLINISGKFNFKDFSAFEQMKMLASIDKNISEESDTEIELFESAPYCETYRQGGKKVNSLAIQLLTSIENKDHSKKFLIPYKDATDCYENYSSSKYELTYYADTHIVATIKRIDDN
jgi:hypothetical protein